MKKQLQTCKTLKNSKKELKDWNKELEYLKEEMKEENDFSSALFGGRSAEDDVKTLADAEDMYEDMEDAKEAKGTKQIALYEAVALDMQNFIDILEYYSENEGAFDRLAEAMEEEDEDMAERMDDYRDWKKNAKKGVKKFKKGLKDWNKELEEMKEEQVKGYEYPEIRLDEVTG